MSEPIPFPGRKVQRAKPDAGVVDMLERLLCMAKSGEVIGVYCATVGADDTGGCVFSEGEGVHALMALGAIDWLKSRVRQRHGL